MFGAQERDFGPLENPVLTIVGKNGQAGSARHANGVRPDRLRVHDGCMHLVHQFVHVELVVNARQNTRELVAAGARGFDAGSKRRQPLRDFAQNRIRFGVPDGLVHFTELIDIDDEQPDSFVPLSRRFDRPLEIFEKRRTIR